MEEKNGLCAFVHWQSFASKLLLCGKPHYFENRFRYEHKQLITKHLFGFGLFKRYYFKGFQSIPKTVILRIFRFYYIHSFSAANHFIIPAKPRNFVSDKNAPVSGVRPPILGCCFWPRKAAADNGQTLKK